MSTFDNLTKPPFHLDAPALAWVRETFGRLTTDDKVRQLFNLMCRGDDAAMIEAMQAFRPGGITRTPGPDFEAERKVLDGFNDRAPVPLIVSADLEGSRMSQPGGTEVPNPLALAALDDVAVTRRISEIMAREARAVGINWTFTPVLDVNAAFRSAIVATRGFGSDPATVARHGVAQMEEFQKLGVAAAVKHWPGEGYDDRDQHLLTTVIPLSTAEWDEVFGRIYREAIAAGAMTLMSGHIALPAFVRELDPDAGVEAFRPASLSRALNGELLRNRFGFNGLIVSDATAMAGLGSWSKRSVAVPEIVANGCDVILFSNNPEADVGYLHAALADGRLSPARLDEAVTRVLALKAAVGLHRPSSRDAFEIGRPEDRAFAEDVMRRIPTLVKDTQDLLPLDPQKHRRVLLLTPGVVNPWMPQAIPFILPDLLRERGFEVTAYTPGMPMTPESFDLVLYLFGDETLMTRSRIFLDWLKLMGNPMTAMERPWHDVPSLMISFGYPYMLYDAPRMPTYINAYMTTDSMQRAVVDLLLGNGTWNRNSPVDPFCGLEDARY